MWFQLIGFTRLRQSPTPATTQVAMPVHAAVDGVLAGSAQRRYELGTGERSEDERRQRRQ